MKAPGDHKIYPFRKATLNNCNGDIKKRWYISFYVWDVRKNKLVRKRLYDINNYSTAEERNAHAKRQIKIINELLQDGYYINETAYDEEEKRVESITGEFLSLNNALNYALNLKKSTREFRKTSYLSYKSVLKEFTQWADMKNISAMHVSNFDRLKARFYIDFLHLKNHSGVTINKNVAYLKAMFSMLVDREIIKENPFKGIKKQKEVITKQNIAFTDKEMELLKISICHQDKELWLFIKFMYYCFLRPNEIRHLKYENINTNDGKLLIPSHISKNSNYDYVMIPKEFLQDIKKIDGIENKKGYIFRKTNKNEPISKNVMGDRHKRYLEDLSLFDGQTFYSWKHTGVVKAYKSGIKIKSIQMQCRHHSLEQTDTYLKSLGLTGDDEITDLMPGI